MQRLSIVLLVVALGACGTNKAIDPPAELVDFEPRLKVQRLWTHTLGGQSTRLRLALRVAVVDGIAYAGGYDGNVLAVAADTGRKRWSVKTGLPLAAGPGVGHGLVVFGATDGTVIALEAATGRERWRQRATGEVLATPVIAGNVVLVRTVDGRLTAFDVVAAKQRWAVEQTVPRLSLRGTAPPVVAGDTVIAGFDNGRVVAVDLSTGDVQWDTVLAAPQGRTELERLVDIDAPARVLGDDVFVTGFQGRIAMLARDSGQIWWAREFSSYRGLNIEGATIFATSAQGVVVAMRRSDGNVVWEQPALRQRALTAPTVDGNTLIVGDYEGYLHWLSTTDGSLLARVKTDGDRITNAPVAIDGRIFVQTDAGKVMAFKTMAKG